MATATHTFTLFADYHTFFVRDEDTDIFDATPNVTNQDIDDMFLAARGGLAIYTARNLDVSVTVELRDDVPEDDPENWDQVVDASIAILSGRLFVTGFWEIQEKAGDVNVLEVVPSVYRARIFYGALDKIDEMGIEGDDHYRVVLWPGETIAPRVLKRWVRGETG